MSAPAVQLPATPRAESPRALRHGTVALRTAAELDAIAAAGAVVAAALEAAESVVRPGATTRELDAAVRAAIASHPGAEPAFLGYPGPEGTPAFPAAACVSVDEEVVHGIPGDRALVAGQLVSIDVGVRLDGWHADAAVTVIVPGGEAVRVRALEAFVADAWESLHAGIASMQPGMRWSDVAARMQRTAAARGHGLVDGWHGHGVGRSLHEAPQAPAIVTPGLREQRDFTLLSGMVLAVEPILVQGARAVIGDDGCASTVPTFVRADGWTVAVAAGLVAAHVEHTVAVTRSGPRILTRRPHARAAGTVHPERTEDGGCCRIPG
ncbi:MAG: type I methionyl aminopeptidase [Phycisphaerales bacterium]